MFRVVLVDDEKMSLDQLKYLLSQYAEITVTAALTDPLEALREITTTKPDMVFLDIEMPEVNGLIVAEEIQAVSPSTAIIFVTGFEDYAAKAFDVDAIDYVLKPISKKRVERTVTKVLKHLNRGGEGQGRERERFTEKQNRSRANNLKKIIAWEDDRIILIDPAHILMFSFQDRDVLVITKNGQYKTRQTLNHWEERLAGMSFFRCHRSFLINLDKIEKILPMFNNTFLLKMADYHAEIPVSRSKANQLKQILSL